jgi:glycosyltransferase involved in cell wall biosynthesis
MKIAIVIFDITRMAGTERAVCNLANLLVSHDSYEVFIVSIGSSSGNPQYKISSNIIINHAGLNVSSKKINRLLMYTTLIRKIREFCVNKKIDIILGTSHVINMMLPFLSVNNLRTVGCEHISYFSIPALSRFLRRITYRFLDAVVILTQSDEKYFCIFQKYVKVIPNSLSFFPERYANLNSKIILAIGRLTYQKGFDMLVKAINMIKKECTGWSVKIIGDGEEKEKLIKQIDELGLSNIIKIYHPTTELEKEYLNASIFVMSSRFEGLPMVLIEAKSFGIPIVSFDCPEGPRAIIENNHDGLLVEKNDVKKLALSIKKLVNNQEERIVFGNNAVKNIEKFKPENVYKLWNNLFNSL